MKDKFFLKLLVKIIVKKYLQINIDKIDEIIEKCAEKWSKKNIEFLKTAFDDIFNTGFVFDFLPHKNKLYVILNQKTFFSLNKDESC